MSKEVKKKYRGKNKAPKAQSRPELIASYALERAKGTPKAVAAEKLGISRRQTYHLEKSAPNLSDLIRSAGEQLARNGLESAVNVITNTINETMKQGVEGKGTKTDEYGETQEVYLKDLHKNQLTLRKLGIMAAEDVLKGTGILSTPTAAPVIQNLTVQQTNVLLPAVRNVLQAISASALNAEKEPE